MAGRETKLVSLTILSRFSFNQVGAVRLSHSPPPWTHPSRSVEVRLELLEDVVPDQVEAAEEVARQERLVELGQVLGEEVGQGADCLLRGEVLGAPGQVEDVLLYPGLKLE